MDKKELIRMYIKDNFKKVKCSKCSTTENVGVDDLSGDKFCLSCLEKDLETDEQALEDYADGFNGED